ncbi:Ankyrin-1 [Acropora cervicornis]|uniref:Ankyrin-1 n=1 Tax=Acropora cervicornis TaxID=6130 RepID=A0AAD9QBG8_ACRCE|nr:Ankyrin-1 [Acropora cervicornis]
MHLPPIFAQQGNCRDSPTKMFQAINDGDVNSLQEILKERSGSLLNSFRTEEGDSPLHLAAQAGNTEVVKLLVENGAKVNVQNDGITAEQLAINMEAESIIEMLQAAKDERQTRPSSFNVTALLLQALKSESVEDLKELIDFEENGDAPIHFAVRTKNVEMCKLLMHTGAKTDTKNTDGNTCLHLSAELGDVPVTRFLLSQKAKPNIVNNDGDTPLHLACQRKHVAIVDLLLGKFNASINIPNKKSDTPLFVAVRVNCLQAIKEMLNSSQAEQDVKNGRSANGDTLLHLAVANKDLEVAKLLIQAGSPPDEQNNMGRTPLHIAASKGDEEMVKFLQTAKANPNILDNDEMTPLHHAAQGGHQTIVSYFLEKFKPDHSARNRDGSTLLHLTCRAGQMEASVALIKRGVLIHMPNKNKYTALHVAALNKKHLAAQLLVGFGADVTVIGGVSKETPLHMAAKVKGGEKVVDVLIKSGADPDTAKEDGERALHLAARCGNVDVVKLLLREDTEVARRSKSGDTPIHFACHNGHYEIVRVLVEKIFKVKSRALARLVINIPNNVGQTALHSVAAIPPGTKSNPRDIVSIVQLLLESGADLTLTTYNKRETPLHLCSRSGNHEVVEVIFTSEKVAEHVKLSIINKATESGASALMIASQCGMLEVVQELLRFHARVDVFDEVGGTALHYAASKGHVDVARELLNHKAYVNGKTKPNARNCDGKTIRVKEDDDDTLVRLCAPQQTMFDKNLNTINNLNTNINIDNF